jgi:hypothetical protein
MAALGRGALSTVGAVKFTMWGMGVVAAEPSNTAAASIRSVSASSSSMPIAPPIEQLKQLLAENFVCNDYRTGGFNFGQVGRDQYIASVKSWWEVGDTPPQFDVVEIVAIRGERCAAVLTATHLGGMVVEGIECVLLDPSLRRWLAVARFDASARGRAVDQLDEWLTQLDGATTVP